ncbi:unnamed protein product [Anisakis simplex]|uniref:Uncharacterized protein n=1 Tax=Anisakis simplex TaxID=6269 RepID=A0A0M3K015_ANISI|nr:unnamed protein product [Anisakis simplex]
MSSGTASSPSTKIPIIQQDGKPILNGYASSHQQPHFSSSAANVNIGLGGGTAAQLRPQFRRQGSSYGMAVEGTWRIQRTNLSNLRRKNFVRMSDS